MHVCVLLGTACHTLGYKHSVQEIGGRDAGILSGISNQVGLATNEATVSVPVSVSLLYNLIRLCPRVYALRLVCASCMP